jgi:hypothetical protein
MKTIGVSIILLVGVGLSAQQVLASSSISTRVKVVEEKVRLHDKKLRELSAQQELTNKQIEQLQQARLEAEKAMAAKAEADLKTAQTKAAVTKKVKLENKQSVIADSKATKPAIKPSMDPGSYAFP